MMNDKSNDRVKSQITNRDGFIGFGAILLFCFFVIFFSITLAVYLEGGVITLDMSYFGEEYLGFREVDFEIIMMIILYFVFLYWLSCVITKNFRLENFFRSALFIFIIILTLVTVFSVLMIFRGGKI